MKRHLPFALAMFLCLAGCCSINNASKLPLVIKGEDGVRYKLLAYYSIQQKIDSETDEDRHLELFIQGLREKFPDDQKLNDYLQPAGKRMHEVNVAYIKELEKIKIDLAKSGGDLYHYESFDSDFDANYVNTNNPVGAPDTDEGLLILAKSKIYKKY
jgi:hypothetical protein